MCKKIASGVFAATLIAGLFSATAFAGGHHRSSTSSQSAYSLCTTQGCNLTTDHVHNGKNYAGYTANDGHNHGSHGTNNHH